MMSEADPHTTDWIEAAKRLLGDDVRARDETHHTVTSGESIARVRQWPPDTTVERVQAVRALHAAVPEEAGIPRPVGGADGAVLVRGRVYDATTVLDGVPLSRNGRFLVPGHGAVAIPLHETADHGDMLVQAASLLGTVHQATRGQIDPVRTGAFSARDLHTATRAAWQEWRRDLGRQAADLPEVRRWLRCGNRVIPIADDRLRAAGADATGTPVLVHGDLWPAWLMVDVPSRPRVLHGIDGWTGAVAGSPVLDLAALCARVTGWSAATVEEVLGAYSDRAELTPGARRIVPVVAAVDLLHQVGRMLEMAFIDDRVANDPAQPFIRGGIAVLLRSLEHLTDVLAPPEPGGRGPGGPRRGFRQQTPPGRSRGAAQSRRGSGPRRRGSG